MDAIKKLLSLLPTNFQISFAIYCARDVSINLNAETRAPAIAAIELTQKWLNYPSSVYATELKRAAHAAYAAYSAANSAANSAACAACAANSAANSAASDKTTAKKLAQYENELRHMIKSLTKLEKEIYNLTNIKDNI